VALTFHYRCGSGCGSRGEGSAARVAVLPGAWNPPTVAHIGIARAALEWADEVVFILPRAFPHKGFEGASFEERIGMLCQVAAAERGMSVASSEGGLYLEIAEEAAEALEPQTEIGLVCGRDAAERIATWDYGMPGVFEAMIARYPLLVAGRAGEYVPAPGHSPRITILRLAGSFDEVSSTEIRRRIAAGERWRDLVPEAIVPWAAEVYGR
jgi:nicotinate-nucleotide adenylyltransferase